LRIDHLPAIKVPTHCLSGTKDPLCTPELMEMYRPKGPHWTQHWIENADHSYAATGRKAAEVMSEIGDAVVEWAAALR
jgi:predicted alpha/beta-hydrolase family hydrolase